MSVDLGGRKKRINDKRRENKKRLDMLRKGVHRQEVRTVFNTFYRGQLAELYKEVKGK